MHNLNDTSRPYNGTWIQDIAYQIEHLSNQFNNYISGCTSGTTATGQTNVYITELKCIPQNDIVVVENVSTLIKQEPLTVSKNIVVCTPPPKITNITIKDAYVRVCGYWNPSDSKYVNCMNCVDNFILNNTNVSLNSITPSGTGCKRN